MKVAILQSDYIPWKGYFDILNMVDLFIFHDDLQYTKQDWRNRNKIKTANGTQWLSIPCGADEKRLICEVELKDHTWQKKHWNKIVHNYSKAAFFNNYRDFFEDFYLGKIWKNLSEMNQYLIKTISHEFLSITTEFDDSRKYNLKKHKAQRVIELLKKCHADQYISGPAAKNYLTENICRKNNILIHWMDYSAYPEYRQFFPPFDHKVSIIDLLFHEGPNAKKYLSKLL